MLSDEELSEELESILLDAVHLRMIADVPVGVLLSGGIDSSLITAMAASGSCAGEDVHYFVPRSWNVR